MLSVDQDHAIAERSVEDVDHHRRHVKAVADDLHERAAVLDEGGQDRRIAMIERRHPVERVGQRAETQTDRQHSFAVARRRMPGRADDAVLQEDAQRVAGAVDLGRHRHQQTRALARIDHLLRSADGRRWSSHSGRWTRRNFGLRNGPSKWMPEAARALRGVLFELVGRLDDFGRRVQHRFPRRRHDAGDETGRAHSRVRRSPRSPTALP